MMIRKPLSPRNRRPLSDTRTTNYTKKKTSPTRAPRTQRGEVGLVAPKRPAYKPTGGVGLAVQPQPTYKPTGEPGVSPPIVKAKRRSVAKKVERVKATRATAVAPKAPQTNRKSSQEKKTRDLTGMSYRKSGAMGLGKKKPKSGWITRLNKTPRI